MSQTSSQNHTTHGQSLPAGTHLEEFVIERVLGVGGFGITYLAKDSSLGRQVVIKENLPAQFCWRDTHALTVRPRHTEGEDADNFSYSLESFRKEAATLASLDHPGIVKVLRSFQAHGTAYFVMPFVEGTALDEVIRQRTSQGNPFTEAEIQDLLTKVLEALGYLHERGIYHRDIKPGNILMTKVGPVLIDFGAARQRLSERSLTVIESPGYTPFEQLQSRGKIGPWSDLYALGTTLYKAITGQTPAKATDRAFDDPEVPLAQRDDLRGRYSHELLASIDNAMSPKASDRFQDAGQWRDSVEGESAQMVQEVVTPSIPPQGSPRLPAISPAPDASRVSLHEEHQRLLAAATEAMRCNYASAATHLFKQLENKRFPDLDYSQVQKYVSKRAHQRGCLIAISVIVFAPLVILIITSAWEQGQTTRQDLDQEAPIERELLLTKAGTRQLAPSNYFNTAQIGDTRTVDLGSGVKLTLCYIPPGSFTMGSPAIEAERGYDEDQVQVKLSRGYWLGKTECTQAQWRAVMNNEPSKFKGDDLPVEQVNWDDANEFMTKLNGRNLLPSWWKWSLPSEAQWEYACRAGTTTACSFGDSLSSTQANFDGNYPYGLGIKGPYIEKTRPVGSYSANAWGLQDMHGNVHEWCRDWYADKLPGSTDPTVAYSAGSLRVYRGGSWNYFGRYCRSASRSRYDPSIRFSTLGFRAAAVPVEQ